MVKKAVESQPKCNFSMDNYEEFLVASAHYMCKDTKGAIRSHKSKDRQYNEQVKKDKK
jgi:hypothetical protein